MNTTEIIAALDSEISRLKQVRDLLASREELPRGRKAQGASSGTTELAGGADASPKRGPGRPKGSVNKATSFTPAELTPKRGTMSVAGRERIAAAQRARWAKRKESEPTKPAKTSGKPGRPAKATGAKRPVGRPPKALSPKGKGIATKKAATSKLAAKLLAKPAKKSPAVPSSTRDAAKKSSSKKGATKQAGASAVPTASSAAADVNVGA